MPDIKPIPQGPPPNIPNNPLPPPGQGTPADERPAK